MPYRRRTVRRRRRKSSRALTRYRRRRPRIPRSRLTAYTIYRKARTTNRFTVGSPPPANPGSATHLPFFMHRYFKLGTDIEQTLMASLVRLYDRIGIVKIKATFVPCAYMSVNTEVCKFMTSFDQDGSAIGLATDGDQIQRQAGQKVTYVGGNNPSKMVHRHTFSPTPLQTVYTGGILPGYVPLRHAMLDASSAAAMDVPWFGLNIAVLPADGSNALAPYNIAWECMVTYEITLKCQRPI